MDPRTRPVGGGPGRARRAGGRRHLDRGGRRQRARGAPRGPDDAGGRGVDRHLVLHVRGFGAPARRADRARLRRLQGRCAGAGREVGRCRLRRPDLVGPRVRKVRRGDLAQRTRPRGQGRVRADRLAVPQARGAAGRQGRPARRRHRRLVRWRGLAPRRRARQARRRHRTGDLVLEPRRRALPRRGLQEALGGDLHHLGRRLRQVREATVRHVRTGRRLREAGRRRPCPADRPLPGRRRRPHQGARAHRAGTDRLPLPARSGRCHGTHHQRERRTRLRRLDRGRARRRGPGERSGREPDRIMVRPVPEGGQGRRHRAPLPRHPYRRHQLHRWGRPPARCEQRPLPGTVERRPADRAHGHGKPTGDHGPGREQQSGRHSGRRERWRTGRRLRRSADADLPEPGRRQPARHLRRPGRRRRTCPALHPRRRTRSTSPASTPASTPHPSAHRCASPDHPPSA